MGITFHTLLTLFFFLPGSLAFSSTLNPGDLAILSMNADGNDDFSFVLLTGISGTTSVKFTDEGWDSNTGDFGTASEGIVTWSFTGSLSFGTIVSVFNPASATVTTSHGSVSKTGSFNVSGGGDQLLAYRGTEASPTFIYAFNHRANCWSSCTVGSSSLNSNLPPGLTNGSTALTTDPTHADNWQYNCAVSSGTKAEILTGIANAGNYNSNNSTVLSAPTCSFALPVELVRFHAQPLENGKVSLEWETASEIQNSHFDIEYSWDGQQFFKAGQIDGHGTSPIAHRYSYIFENAKGGLNYFRLRQVDFDGQEDFSPIVAVEIKMAGEKALAYPNPVKNTLFIKGENIIWEVVISDAFGQYVFGLEPSETSFEINTSDLPPGIYTIGLNEDNGQWTVLRFVKK